MIPIVVLAVAYVLAGKLGLLFSLVHEQTSAVWPASGLALAALLIWGYRLWPGVFIGALLVNLTAGHTLDAARVLASLGIAAGNTLEALIGAYLVNRYAGGARVFERAADVFRFSLLAGLVSTGFAAVIGSASLALAGIVAWTEVPDIRITWWTGDAAGIILFAPLVILWWRDRLWKWSVARNLELTAVGLAICLAVLNAWTELSWNQNPHIGLAVFCMPLLLWVAFRFGQREISIAVLPFLAAGVWGSQHGLTAGSLPPLMVELEVTAYVGITSVMLLALAAEVSYRRREQKALEERSLALWKQARLLDLAPALILDTEYRITMWSSGAQSVYGFTVEEALGQTVWALLQTKYPEPLEQIRARLFASGHWEGVLRQKAKDGRDVTVSSHWVLHPGQDGEPASILKVDTDITDRERLRSERMHLAAIVESSEDAVTSATLDGTITSWNAGAERIFGYASREIIGQRASLLLPDGAAGEGAFLEGLKKLQQGEPWRQEMELRRDDGRLILVATTLSPVRGPSGEITGVSAVSRDITERRREEERFRLTVEAAPTGMLAVNGRGRITLVNAQTEKLFGYTRGELVGQPIEMLIPQEFRQAHLKHRTDFRLDPQARAMGLGRDLRGVRKDGVEFPVEIGLNPIWAREGMLILASVVDITERIQAEQERVRHAEVEAAARGRADGLLEMYQRLEATVEETTQVVYEGAMQALAWAHIELHEMEPGVPPSLLPHLERTADALLQAEEYLRSFPHDLRPTVLDDLGLPHALRFLAERAGKRSGLAVEVENTLQGRLPGNVELALYRFVHEALNHAGNHAGEPSLRAGVRLQVAGEEVCCVVWEQGAEGDIADLSGIRSSIASLGGKLETRSGADGSREMQASIPLRMNPDHSETVPSHYHNAL